MNKLNIDVVDFLTRLGVKNVSKHGVEVSYSCPFPGHSHGDRNPSADMRMDTTQFKCWGCGAYGNAVTFLADLEGIPPHVALNLIEEEYGSYFVEPEGSVKEHLQKRWAARDEPEKTQRRLPDEEVVERYWVDWWGAYEAYTGDDLQGPFAYMFERGFTPDTLDEWNVGWCDGVSRIAIPVRAVDGTLLGFKGRAWHPEHQPRYITLGGDDWDYDPYESSGVLFGLHKAVQSKAYLETGQLIVVEGELNALSMHAKGWTNTCGASGRWLSVRQLDLLKHYAQSAAFIYDDQTNGIENARQLHGVMPCWVAASHREDPADSSKAEIERMLAEAESSVTAGRTARLAVQPQGRERHYA